MAAEPFYVTLASSLVIKLAGDLLDATTRRVREKFAGDEKQKALTTALQEALETALGSFHLEKVNEDHFKSLFEDFLLKPDVVDELTHMIDPRPDVGIDIELIRHEFHSEGFDSETLHYFDFVTFIQLFGEAFYTAASKQSELQGAIQIGLLRNIIDQISDIAINVKRTARATEQTATATTQIADELGPLLRQFLQGQTRSNELIESIRVSTGEGFDRTYELQENFIALMHRAGYHITVGDDSNVIIGDRSQVPGGPSQTALDELQKEISLVRQSINKRKQSEIDLSLIEDRYRLHIIRWFERLTFQGMMRTAQAISLPLEDIYVELRAISEVPEAADTFSAEERRLLLEVDEGDEHSRQELTRQLDTMRKERWSRTSVDRKSITEALFAQDKRAFVILGDPGSGKSTLLHLLALIYAKGPNTIKKYLIAPEQELKRLPIFAPLAAFDDFLRAQPGMTLLEFLPKYFDRRQMLPGLAPLFQNAMESGNALILLDGLDEVLDSSTRSYVANQVTNLINAYNSRGVRFVLTSRFVGYREAPVGQDIPHLSVLDFGLTEIKTFVHQWSHTYETWVAGGNETPESIHKAHVLERDLLEDVNSIASVRRLAANPLMLTMLALLRRQVGRLPHRRIELYERYMETMIDNWVDARSLGEREHALSLSDPHHAESLLIPLAYWLQSTQPSGTASKANIQNALIDICLRDEGYDPTSAPRGQQKVAEEHAQRFLSEMREMSGLIVERGYDAFGFLHLTFQEYFAGRALAKMDPETRWNEVGPHLHDPRWREPILLCAGQLGIVEKRRPEVSDFVRIILNHDDPTENDLHRNLLLALSIACDDVNLEPGLLIELINHINQCLPINIYVFAGEIAKRLSQLILNDVNSAEFVLAKILETTDSELKIAVIEGISQYIDQPSRIREITLQLLNDEDPGVQVSAIEALSTLVASDDTIRYAIVQCIDNEDWTTRISAIEALSTLVTSDDSVRHAILQRLDDEDHDVQTSAASALLVLISSDSRIRHILFQRLDDPDQSLRAFEVEALSTLVSSDGEVRQVALQHLNDQSQIIRRIAVEVLSTLVSSDGEVRQAILQHLDDKDERVRSSAIEALSTLLSSDSEVRQAILQHLDDKDEGVRSSAFEALSSSVLSDADIRQAITNQLQAVSWRLRIKTINLIGQNLKDPTIIPHMLPLIASAEHFLSAPESTKFIVESLAALSALISSDGEVRQIIFQHLNDQNPSVRSSAIRALSTLVSSDGEVRQAIFRRLDDPSEYVRSAAIEALSTLVSSDGEVRQAIFQQLDDQNEGVRSSAVMALLVLASSNVEVHQGIEKIVTEFIKDSNLAYRFDIALNSNLMSSFPGLLQSTIEQLNDKNWYLRYNVLYALKAFVPSNIDVRHAILQCLEDEEINIQNAAASALSTLASSDSHIRHIIFQRLEHTNNSVRSAAIKALSTLVSSDGEVRQAIFQRLDDPGEYVRSAAIEALSTLVSSDGEVRQAIFQRIDDQNEDVRSSAVTALSALVSSDGDIRQAILQRLDDQNINVRISAIISLSKLETIDILEKSNRQKLLEWISSKLEDSYRSLKYQAAQQRLSHLFGLRLISDDQLLSTILEWLRSPRWPTRLGAVHVLLAWPGGMPKEILQKILNSLNDNRGMESYPARLTAANYLINREPYSKEAIQLGLEALEYGTMPWEQFPRESGEVRKQAALLLGTLEPIRYDPVVYDKLLQVMKTDEDSSVRDTAYTTLAKLAGMRT